MRHLVAGFKLTFCIALLSAGPVFAQTPSEEAISNTTTTAPVAYVYLGTTTKGVYLYDAASNGKLTQVSGSPFKTSGLAIGSNGKHFISLGTVDIHSYTIESNGAIGEQVSTINTQDHDGSACGTTDGAILDHTGQDLYVLISGANIDSTNQCDAYQSYKISTSGVLTSIGAAVDKGGPTQLYTLPAITENDTYGYAGLIYYSYSHTGTQNQITFKRESSGALALTNYVGVDPTPEPDWDWYAVTPTADPTNHLAYAMISENEPPDGPFGPVQLASYTVESNGNIVSTNTWKNMPKSAVALVGDGVINLKISPSGKLLAVGGSGGVQIFHFNGAEPITAYTKPLTTVEIDQIRWDNNNHLYALSDSTNKLYVYTVTPTTITESPGSPYTISHPNALVVVPK